MKKVVVADDTKGPSSMATCVIASDCTTDKPLIKRHENSCNVFRGLFFGILFEVLLVLGGIVLWLLLRK